MSTGQKWWADLEEEAAELGLTGHELLDRRNVTRKFGSAPKLVEDAVETRMSVPTDWARGQVRRFQSEAKEWTQRNFPGQQPHEPALGLVEEFGELAEALWPAAMVSVAGRLAHAELKDGQGIRGTADQRTAKVKDAVGDIFIFLCSYCNAKGIDLQDVAEDTWRKVSQRDWKNNPVSAGDEPDCVLSGTE